MVRRLLAIGGAHLDRRGKMDGACRPGASNPGIMHEEVGGGAFNALRVAAGLGVRGVLLSVRGGDVAGAQVAEEAARWGIEDCSATFLDRRTPSYTALLDAEGDLIAGLADMALYDLAFARQLKRRAFRDAAAKADALLCDANIPAAGLEHVVATGKPVFAIAISPAKVVRLASVLDRISVLFMNRREAAELTGLDVGAPARDIAASLMGKGLRAGVVSAGADPCIMFDCSGVVTLSPRPVARVIDVTGAGDALAGATVAALLDGMPLPQAARRGMVAASLALGSGRAAIRISPADLEAGLERTGAPAAGDSGPKEDR